jgi:uncharacterized protein (DUF2236 family)
MPVQGGLFPVEDELEELLVGPDSVTWQFASDVRLYFVMLYPLLLQVAHPTVGAGVRDFSDFDKRPWNRLVRTLDYVSLLVYGGQDAVRAGRRLRAMHKRFQGVREDGERYYALEPEAYAWVHATLLESYVAGHAHFGTPMNRDQLHSFYREYRGLGRLLGVRERDLPPDWDAFREYFDHTMQTELVRTVSVDRVLHSVRYAARPPVPLPDVLWRAMRVPARRALWVGGLGLMDPDLRQRLGVAWTPSDQATFRAMGAFTRRLTPVMPRSLRITGPAQLRMRRRAIARGPLGSDAPANGSDAPANPSDAAAAAGSDRATGAAA